ncbi:ScyD/ScyE family protein [Phototrophicus methaneseepsis]|uniref:ScyD/ScyE family protein n=1 Tax=Phototrophicus methaneseepsis TaxID=2710758 RepID=A0A7S8E908_9CHLR|nr:ScyD/ScyE family protein [Phototrophicus methaneseepsis]QPC82623.1 ScyD/ScyE family protein [Phototrophicus methaneseepsis]
MKRRRALFLFVTALAAMLALPVTAQDSAQVFADGLANPRNMSFDSEGNLYVAEAGVAGTQLTDAEVAYGATGQITRIAPDGTKDVLVHGLISYRDGNPLGPAAVQIIDDTIWMLLNETSDFSIPFTHALVGLDRNTLRVKTFVDLLTLELTDDPDGNPNEQSNPTDFAIAPDGTFVIANAGCNCLMQWTPEDGVSVLNAWDFDTDNPVPTTVEFGPDGDLYVGFLTGFPFPEGGSRIERWSEGELVETYDGLTAITSLIVPEEGTIYAVQLGVFDQGWGPGRVIMIDENGITPILEDLTNPYGIIQGPDGTIFVSTNTFGAADGQILMIPMS